MASKGSGLGCERRDDVINCRNNDGMISAKCGNDVVNIFVNDFFGHCFYSKNPTALLRAKICKELFGKITEC